MQTQTDLEQSPERGVGAEADVRLSLRCLIQRPRLPRLDRIARDLGEAAEGWEADARLMGNVTAEEIRDLCQWAREQFS